MGETLVAAAKYQVFISSTYEDLKEERDQVIRAVLEMGHIPVGMEMFSAADEEQWKIIARHIDESDYYAVVAAHRLGSLTDSGISYTRKEYEYARDAGIPILGFIIEDQAPWPSDKIDRLPQDQEGLSEFKGLIREKPVSFWSTADDLYGKFSVALMKAITSNPRPGWMRATHLESSPEVTAEVIRLSAENATLRQRIQAAEKSADDERRNRLREIVETLSNAKRKLAYRYTPRGEWQHDQEISLLNAFLKLAPEMMVEANITDMAGTLAMEMRADKDRGWDIVATNQVKDVMADFTALELVQPSKRKHAVADTNEYWSLSPTGMKVLTRLRKTMLAHRPENKPESSASANPSPSTHENQTSLTDSSSTTANSRN